MDIKPSATVNATSAYQPAARIIANFIDNKTNKSVAGAVLNIMTADAAGRDLSLTEAKPARTAASMSACRRG